MSHIVAINGPSYRLKDKLEPPGAGRADLIPSALPARGWVSFHAETWVTFFTRNRHRRRKKPTQDRAPTEAIARLAAHRERQALERTLAGNQWRDSELLFTTSVGTPLDRHNVTRNFKRLLRLGVPRQRFHDLRHGCASLLFAQGLTPKDVTETLGHSQISTTADQYGHIYDSRRQDS